MNRLAATSAAALLAGLSGCAGRPLPPPPVEHAPPPRPTAAASVKAPAPEPKEPPPPSGPARPFTSPKIAWAELPNGLKVASVLDRAVPLVQVRLAVLAGSAVDGDKPGLSAMCTRAIARSGAGAMDERELGRRLESLGGTLSIDTGPDRVAYGLSVPRDALGEALAILSTLVEKPRLGAADVTRVKKQAAAERADRARTDGRWAARMVLADTLYQLPAEHHPYASHDAQASDIERLGPAECRAFHRRHFVPRNMLLVVTGDARPEEVKTAADKAFRGLRGPEAPAVSFTDPMPLEITHITVVDRPGSAQSEILVGVLGPRQEEPTFAAFRVAEQVLGGASTGRLYLDLRATQGLSYIPFADTEVFAGGPSLFYTRAATATAQTEKALGALLEEIERLGQETPTETEVTTAARFLDGMRAVERGRPGVRADEIADLWAERLPDEAPDELTRAILDVKPDEVTKAFAEYVRPGHLAVVVAGDANAMAPSLTRFGEVKVVDPTRNFARLRTLRKGERDAPSP